MKDENQIIYGQVVVVDLPTRENGKHTDYYIKWYNMLRRCYNSKYHKKYPTYAGSSVSSEWHILSVFKDWYYSQPNYGKSNMDLDKDILQRGNKIYGPQFCRLVPRRINTLLLDSRAARGPYPIGVCFDNHAGKYKANCRDGSGKRRYLGLFDTADEAFLAYKAYKEQLIKDVDEEDYCYPEMLFDDVKVPHTIKDLYSRRRMLEIENHIIETDNSLLQKELKYHSAKSIKLISEGVHYTIGKEDADMMLNRLKALRQRQCNNLPFNSTGFVIDVRIGEKNYLKRLLTEHDRKTKEGREKIRKGIERMRGLRGKVDKFNNVNMVAPNEKNTPDVGQFYTKGRLYSFITEVPREYRAAMYYVDAKNQIDSVVDLDIKASHTNFLPIVLRIMCDQLFDGLEAINIRTELVRYIELLKDLKLKKSDLYNKIAADMKTTRKEIKEKWQKYINDHENIYIWTGDNKVDDWFYNNFPALHKMINKCHDKERKNMDKKTKWRSGEGYLASIPLQLHKIENQLFVKPAAESFLGNFSLCSNKSRESIMTVHDSFLVPKSSEAQMRKVLDNQIRNNSILNNIQIKSSEAKRDCGCSDSSSLNFSSSNSYNNSSSNSSFIVPYSIKLNSSFILPYSIKLNSSSHMYMRTGCVESEYKLSTREKNNISKHRNGWKCRVHGNWIYSWVKEKESKEQFEKRIEGLVSEAGVASNSMERLKSNQESSQKLLEPATSSLDSKTLSHTIDSLERLLPAYNDKCDGYETTTHAVDDFGRYL